MTKQYRMTNDEGGRRHQSDSCISATHSTQLAVLMRRLSVLSLLAWVAIAATFVAAADPPLIEVAKNRRGFVIADSGRPFVPWGFNYDHDERSRLIEDY